MKKTFISLFLITTIVCSTFTAVFATHDTDPHIAPADTITIVLYTHDTDPH